VERGLARSVKAPVRTICTTGTIQADPADPAAGSVPLSVQSMAQAIQHAMDRRIEGLLTAAARSKQVALGSDAVTGASQRAEAELVVVAKDAAAGADLTAIRLAVTEGRAVAWGSKESLGRILSRGRAGRELAVVAITSRSIAGSLRDVVRIADACAAIAAGQPSKGSPPEAARRGSKGPLPSAPVAAEGGNSHSGGACAPPPNGGKHGTSKGAAASRGDGAHRDQGWRRERGGARRTAERTPAGDREQKGQRNAWQLGQSSVKPSTAPALSQGTRRVAGPARGRRDDG
jgi:ribosomal protein L7Ae-like RNA K-turn-binding protein